MVLREDLVEKALKPRRPQLPRTAGVETEYWAAVPSFGGGLNLKDSLGCLGCHWWYNRETPDGTRLLPDTPPDTFTWGWAMAAGSVSS